MPVTHTTILQHRAAWVLATLATTVFLSGCSSTRYPTYNDPNAGRYSMAQDRAPDQDVNLNHVGDAIPRVEPLSRSGNMPSYVVHGKRYYVLKTSQNYVRRGTASWYGKKFHGHKTSNGETYDMYKMTAANKELPLPTYVLVTNLKNHRSVVVRVNDRGPFHPGRIIDLSYVAAKKLGITATGTAPVEVRAIDPRTWKQSRQPMLASSGPGSSSGSTSGSGDAPLATSGPAATAPVSPNEAERVFLQVGAFSSAENADQLRQKLLRHFASLNILSGYYAAQKLYRVRIGPLMNRQHAETIASQILQTGIAKPHVVVD